MGTYKHNEADVGKWLGPDSLIKKKEYQGSGGGGGRKHAKKGKGKFLITSEQAKQEEVVEDASASSISTPEVEVQHAIVGSEGTGMAPVITQLESGTEREQVKEAMEIAGSKDLVEGEGRVLSEEELHKVDIGTSSDVSTPLETSKESGQKSRDITVYRKHKGSQTLIGFDPIKKFESETYRRTGEDPGMRRLTKYTRKGDIKRVMEAEAGTKKYSRLGKKSSRILSRLSKKTEKPDVNISKQRFIKKGYGAGLAAKIFNFNPSEDR